MRDRPAKRAWLLGGRPFCKHGSLESPSTFPRSPKQHHFSRAGHLVHFFVAVHFPCIWPAKSKSPPSLPSLRAPVKEMIPFGVSRVKLNFSAAQLPLLIAAVPWAELLSPVTFSPSTTILRVNGTVIPCTSAAPSHSPDRGSLSAAFPAPGPGPEVASAFPPTLPPFLRPNTPLRP